MCAAKNPVISAESQSRRKNSDGSSAPLLDGSPKTRAICRGAERRDPYAIWISEIMLQQTQVKTVIPYWERWMRELPTMQTLAKAKQEKVLKLWEGLGYYTRARNLQTAAQTICEKHSGKFPKRSKTFSRCPGLVAYTAGAICSIAFNQPTPILDGNVIRVLTRIFGIARKSSREKHQRTALESGGRTGQQRKTSKSDSQILAPI